MLPSTSQPIFSYLKRLRIWYALLVIIGCVFVVRLFYLQVIRYDHYRNAALLGQLKEYEVPPKRGVIEAYNGHDIVPIVLNEAKYTLFADPAYIEDTSEAAAKIHEIIGGNEKAYGEAMERSDTRYVVLAKKLDKDQKQRIEDLQIKGVGTRDVEYRTYPQGKLAAQLLGFVDDELNGKYGLEQALDSELKGKPGLLKAITDANGVPLASNKDNILIEPEPGKRVVLTIDIGIQQQLEDILQKGVKAAKSASGSALILDANSGAVKAMANYPTYDPAEFFNEENNEVFNNSVVSAPLEVGSVMKPLTMAAALDLGVVNRNSSYFDLGFFHIGDATVTNIEEVGGAATRSLRDILQLSLNTGATWMLMQMGGGEINEKARVRWHDYMTNRYMFGRATGIEQGYEAEGSVPSPTDGFGLDIQFANTSFGQGMSATPLQMGAALASIINGGNYYRPYLVDRYIEPGGDESINKPGVVKNDVVSGETSSTVREFMEFTVANNLRTAYREGYSVGGKTGTAQIVKPGGGYYDDRFNGMYIGFSGTGETQYVIVVLINEPKIAGYAGSQAAGPVFAALSNMLIDNFGASPGN